jgi:hypothetical protein
VSGRARSGVRWSRGLPSRRHRAELVLAVSGGAASLMSGPVLRASVGGIGSRQAGAQGVGRVASTVGGPVLEVSTATAAVGRAVMSGGAGTRANLGAMQEMRAGGFHVNFQVDSFQILKEYSLF